MDCIVLCKAACMLGTGVLLSLGERACHSMSSEPNFQHSDPRMKLFIL
jgi:hypothetical protein